MPNNKKKKRCDYEGNSKTAAFAGGMSSLTGNPSKLQQRSSELINEQSKNSLQANIKTTHISIKP